MKDKSNIEILRLFISLSKTKDYKINDLKDNTEFLGLIDETIKKGFDKNEAFGLRTQKMFEYVAIALGNVSLIKEEDAGEVYVLENIKVPDYRIILKDKREILVEVKNRHKNFKRKKFLFNKEYFESLTKYAMIMDKELYIAIYWNKLGEWTLNSVNNFKCNTKGYEISLEHSILFNHMNIIGDNMVGTTPPLSIRILPSDNVAIKDNKYKFIIKDIELLCNGQKIERKLEQNIAISLMIYGRWEEEKIDKFNDDVLEYIEFNFVPKEKTKNQNFEIVGTLSSIISNQYKHLTNSEDGIERIIPKISPEKMGFEIPEGYKGDKLPLWIFTILPSD